MSKYYLVQSKGAHHAVFHGAPGNEERVPMGEIIESMNEFESMVIKLREARKEIEALKKRKGRAQ